MKPMYIKHSPLKKRFFFVFFSLPPMFADVSRIIMKKKE